MFLGLLACDVMPSNTCQGSRPWIKLMKRETSLPSTFLPPLQPRDCRRGRTPDWKWQFNESVSSQTTVPVQEAIRSLSQALRFVPSHLDYNPEKFRSHHREIPSLHRRAEKTIPVCAVQGNFSVCGNVALKGAVDLRQINEWQPKEPFKSLCWEALLPSIHQASGHKPPFLSISYDFVKKAFVMAHVIRILGMQSG